MFVFGFGYNGAPQRVILDLPVTLQAGCKLHITMMHWRGLKLKGQLALSPNACKVDGRKVGHFLITIQKSFKQLLTSHGYDMAILMKTVPSSSFSL